MKNEKLPSNNQNVRLLKNKYELIDQPNQPKQGAYGQIRLAKDIEKNQIVAIKIIKVTISKTHGVLSYVTRQPSALQSLSSHNNIVNLIDHFFIDGTKYLVFSYIKYNLNQYMRGCKNNRPLPSVTKKIIYQLLSATMHAHSFRFIHRDIKPANILIQIHQKTNKFTLKLADWGLARKFNATNQIQRFTDDVITISYRPPELLFVTNTYKQYVDIWSIGCVFAELIFGEILFMKFTPNDVLTTIVDIVGVSENSDYQWMMNKYKEHGLDQTSFSLNQARNNKLENLFMKKHKKIDQRCDLLKKMLRINPNQRISAEDALKHPYFNKKSQKNKQKEQEELEQPQNMS